MRINPAYFLLSSLKECLKLQKKIQRDVRELLTQFFLKKQKELFSQIVREIVENILKISIDI
jgi:hypothetical protein